MSMNSPVKVPTSPPGRLLRGRPVSRSMSPKGKMSPVRPSPMALRQSAGFPPAGAFSAVSSNSAARKSTEEWNLRLQIQFGRLEDRDTQTKAVKDIRTTIDTMAPHQTQNFTRALLQKKDPPRISARKEMVSLIAYLCQSKPESIPPHLPKLLAYIFRRVSDQEEVIRRACAEAIASIVLYVSPVIEAGHSHYNKPQGDDKHNTYSDVNSIGEEDNFDVPSDDRHSRSLEAKGRLIAFFNDLIQPLLGKFRETGVTAQEGAGWCLCATADPAPAMKEIIIRADLSLNLSAALLASQAMTSEHAISSTPALKKGVAISALELKRVLDEICPHGYELYQKADTRSPKKFFKGAPVPVFAVRLPSGEAQHVFRILKSCSSSTTTAQTLNIVSEDYDDTSLSIKDAPSTIAFSTSTAEDERQIESVAAAHASRLMVYVDDMLRGMLTHIKARSSEMIGSLYEAIGALLTVAKDSSEQGYTHLLEALAQYISTLVQSAHTSIHDSNSRRWRERKEAFDMLRKVLRAFPDELVQDSYWSLLAELVARGKSDKNSPVRNAATWLLVAMQEIKPVPHVGVTIHPSASDTANAPSSGFKRLKTSSGGKVTPLYKSRGTAHGHQAAESGTDTDNTPSKRLPKKKMFTFGDPAILIAVDGFDPQSHNLSQDEKLEASQGKDNQQTQTDDIKVNKETIVEVEGSEGQFAELETAEGDESLPASNQPVEESATVKKAKIKKQLPLAGGKRPLSPGKESGNRDSAPRTEEGIRSRDQKKSSSSPKASSPRHSRKLSLTIDSNHREYDGMKAVGRQRSASVSVSNQNDNQISITVNSESRESSKGTRTTLKQTARKIKQVQSLAKPKSAAASSSAPSLQFSHTPPPGQKEPALRHSPTVSPSSKSKRHEVNEYEVEEAEHGDESLAPQGIEREDRRPSASPPSSPMSKRDNREERSNRKPDNRLQDEYEGGEVATVMSKRRDSRQTIDEELLNEKKRGDGYPTLKSTSKTKLNSKRRHRLSPTREENENHTESSAGEEKRRGDQGSSESTGEDQSAYSSSREGHVRTKRKEPKHDSDVGSKRTDTSFRSKTKGSSSSRRHLRGSDKDSEEPRRRRHPSSTQSRRQRDSGRTRSPEKQPESRRQRDSDRRRRPTRQEGRSRPSRPTYWSGASSGSQASSVATYSSAETLSISEGESDREKTRRRRRDMKNRNIGDHNLRSRRRKSQESLVRHRSGYRDTGSRPNGHTREEKVRGRGGNQREEDESHKKEGRASKVSSQQSIRSQRSRYNDDDMVQVERDQGDESLPPSDHHRVNATKQDDFIANTSSERSRKQSVQAVDGHPSSSAPLRSTRSSNTAKAASSSASRLAANRDTLQSSSSAKTSKELPAAAFEIPKAITAPLEGERVAELARMKDQTLAPFTDPSLTSKASQVLPSQPQLPSVAVAAANSNTMNSSAVQPPAHSFSEESATTGPTYLPSTNADSTKLQDDTRRVDGQTADSSHIQTANRAAEILPIASEMLPSLPQQQNIPAQFKPTPNSAQNFPSTAEVQPVVHALGQSSIASVPINDNEQRAVESASRPVGPERTVSHVGDENVPPLSLPGHPKKQLLNASPDLAPASIEDKSSARATMQPGAKEPYEWSGSGRNEKRRANRERGKAEEQEIRNLRDQQRFRVREFLRQRNFDNAFIAALPISTSLLSVKNFVDSIQDGQGTERVLEKTTTGHALFLELISATGVCLHLLSPATISIVLRYVASLLDSCEAIDAILPWLSALLFLKKSPPPPLRENKEGRNSQTRRTEQQYVAMPLDSITQGAIVSSLAKLSSMPSDHGIQAAWLHQKFVECWRVK